MRLGFWLLAGGLAAGCASELRLDGSFDPSDEPFEAGEALTVDGQGAVNLPSGTSLLLPFPAQHRIVLRSGYGPNAGSVLHTGKTRTDKGNDHYALDLAYADEPNGGLGMPVLAPLPGTVVLAGWATAGWANFGLRVIVRHQLPDGHTYHSSYAHLNAIAPGIAPGAEVERGQLLGEVGRSCQGALACSSFNWPHLHFSLHRDSLIGGTGSGSSYAGRAVIPEALDGHEDLLRGQVLVSTNQPYQCNRADCGPPLTCEGRADGSYCVANRRKECAGGQTVSETVCPDGCAEGECQCRSSRLNASVNSGDCVQVSYASCGRGSCGWWRCAQGAWSCAGPSQCGASHWLSGCTNAPPGEPPPPPRCWSNRLSRYVDSGDCVQVTYASCGASTCGVWTCADGAWVCQGQSQCAGDFYAHPSCG